MDAQKNDVTYTVEKDHSGWTVGTRQAGRWLGGCFRVRQGHWTKAGVMKLVSSDHILNTLWNRVGKSSLGKACGLLGGGKLRMISRF